MKCSCRETTWLKLFTANLYQKHSKRFHEGILKNSVYFGLCVFSFPQKGIIERTIGVPWENWMERHDAESCWAKFSTLHKTSMFDLKQRSCSFQTVHTGTCKLDRFSRVDVPPSGPENAAGKAAKPCENHRRKRPCKPRCNPASRRSPAPVLPITYLRQDVCTGMLRAKDIYYI